MEEYKKLFKSFTYAFSGILHVIRNERNFRIHLSCLTYMFAILGLTDWFTLTKTDWAVLILTSGLVLTLEIVNTAIENAVNLASKEYTEYGKFAKDCGSGAVLVGAFTAVLTGVAILFQKEAFAAMYNYFIKNIPMLILFVLSIVPMSIFIFWGNPFKRKK